MAMLSFVKPVNDMVALGGKYQEAEEALKKLAERLASEANLTRIDEMTFRGMSPPVGPQRVYGGQVAGQALVAAGRTVDPSRRWRETWSTLTTTPSISCSTSCRCSP